MQDAYVDVATNYSVARVMFAQAEPHCLYNWNISSIDGSVVAQTTEVAAAAFEKALCAKSLGGRPHFKHTTISIMKGNASEKDTRTQTLYRSRLGE
jgi:hypothetical protein